MDSLDIILERAGREYSDAEKTAMAAQKNETYRSLLQRLTPDDLLPGAMDMLLALRARAIKTAVGSSSKNTPLILDRIGLKSHFDAVADGNDISRSKPDPEVFLTAADRLGLPAAACLVVEDAQAGIEAGRRAGMAVLGIGTPDKLPGVDPVVVDLAHITVDELLRIG